MRSLQTRLHHTTPVLSVFFLLLPLVSIPSYASNSPYFTNIPVSSSNSKYPYNVEPSMAIGRDEIYVGYKNAVEHDGGGVDVSFTKSKDGGKSFLKPVEMRNSYLSQQAQSDPWLEYYDDSLYFTYLEASTFLVNSQITMAISRDGGTTWNYTRASYNSGFADKETFAISSSGTIFVVYDDVGQTTHLKLSRSTDGGRTFFENVTIDTDVGLVGPYVLASSVSNYVYVTYTIFDTNSSASDIYFSLSNDGGNTWEKISDVTPEGNGAWYLKNSITGNPSLATLPVLDESTIDGRIWLAWADSFRNVSSIDFDVWLKYSDDNGRTWSNRILVNDNLAGNQWMPDIEVDTKGIVHIAYYDFSSQNYFNLKYKTYNPYTGEFSPEIKVNTSPIQGMYTRPGDYFSMRLDKNEIPSIVWTDGREGGLDIYFGKLVYPSSQVQETFYPASNSLFLVLIACWLKRRKFESFPT